MIFGAGWSKFILFDSFNGHILLVSQSQNWSKEQTFSICTSALLHFPRLGSILNFSLGKIEYVLPLVEMWALSWVCFPQKYYFKFEVSVNIFSLKTGKTSSELKYAPLRNFLVWLITFADFKSAVFRYSVMSTFSKVLSILLRLRFWPPCLAFAHVTVWKVYWLNLRNVYAQVFIIESNGHFTSFCQILVFRLKNWGRAHRKPAFHAVLS